MCYVFSRIGNTKWRANQANRRFSIARTDKSRTPALAYLRTSSAANLGDGKDSYKRQHDAIVGFSRHAGFEIVGEFYDAAVSGADPIDTRPEFMALLERIRANGVRVVIVEDASRFARKLLVQEAGIAVLASAGVRVLTSRGDDLTDSDDEMRVAMRQIAGVFSQLEKTRLVKKLKAARDRKSKAGKRVEGRKSRRERLRQAKGEPATARLDEAVALARRLRRANPITHKRMSLRKISTELAAAGHLNERGQPYNPKSILELLERPMTKGEVR
jgi:DNA invertase Pin-like site-specific DNA recombinase